MCLPKVNEVCNGTLSPVYIKHDGKIDHWLTDIRLQECKNKSISDQNIDVSKVVYYRVLITTYSGLA